jgi:hypothetical protein
MNPSSLDIDLWLLRAKGSAVQRQKEMYKLFGSTLFVDEGCSYRVIFFSGIDSVELHCVPVRELTAFGSPSTIENILFCEATSYL